MMKALQENIKSYFYNPKLGKSFPRKMQTWSVKEKKGCYSTILNLKTLYDKSIKTKILKPEQFNSVSMFLLCLLQQQIISIVHPDNLILSNCITLPIGLK